LFPNYIFFFLYLIIHSSNHSIKFLYSFHYQNPAISFETANHTWKNLARVAILCNVAEFEETNTQQQVLTRNTIGDPTDSALLRCIESVEGDAAVFRQMHRTVLHIPFNPDAKIQVQIDS
jgi:hypothetical protein